MVLAHDIQKGLRTQDVRISEDITFDSMLLAANTLQGLNDSGFHKPSPVQLHGIPLGKCGFDLLLEAKSGTGKTAVFSVITLEKLNLTKGLQTIILAPTREIAAQICDVIKQIGAGYKKLSVEVVMGGLPVQDDIAKFKKKTHIVVGSPGRLRHLIQDNHIDISAVRLLVLDEADKLMDKSFRADINYIFSTLPKQKQVIMSSATYPEMLQAIINKYVSNAQHICPDSTSILLGIKQLFTIVKSNTNIVRQTQHRFEELLNILSKKKFKQCLIFCNYQVRVGELGKMLKRENWPAEQLHGQQEQTDRLEALKTLQQYKCRILISTDLAARGIDASNVDMVINFEPPFEWQTYLHRIGRAGRFGSFGVAISILSEGQEQKKFKEMLESISDSLKLRNVWDDNEIFHDLPASKCSNETLKHRNSEQNLECDEIDCDLITSATNSCSINLEKQPASIKTVQDLSTTVITNETCSQTDLKHHPASNEAVPTTVINSVTCLHTDFEQQIQNNDTVNNLLDSVTHSVTELQTDLGDLNVLKNLNERSEHVTLKNNDKELWDVLIEQHVGNNKKEILKLEDLSKSFEANNESEINSFSDLMTSYEAFADNSENIPYKYIMFQKLPLDDASLPLIDSTTFNPKVNDAADDQIIHIQDENQLANKSNEPKNTSSRFTKFKNKLKQKLDRKLKVKNSLVDDELCPETENWNKALIEAGLPTSFGGKKYNKRKTETNCYKPKAYTTTSKQNIHEKKMQQKSKPSDNEVEDLYMTQTYSYNRMNTNPLKEADWPPSLDANLLDENKSNKNLVSRIYENKHDKKTSKNKFSESCTFESNAKSSEDEIGDAHNNQSFISSKSENNVQYQRFTSKKENFRRKSSSRQKSYELSEIEARYNAWYNQLKTHIKQVEMFAYMGEMAKIK